MMDSKLHFVKRVMPLIFAILFIVNCYLSGNAQNNGGEKNNDLLPPAEEKFEEATDLIVPWRSSGCSTMNREFREPDCHLVTGREWTSSEVVTLYNEDGSLWYRFSLNAKSPDYFVRNTKTGFLPFATFPAGADTVILRQTGESPNWYKVEVNEETRAAKFVLKNDPMWAKTKWSYWLYQMQSFKYTDDFPLLDKPNGKTIEESAGLQFETVKFLKADGDWAFVEGYIHPKAYRGWIRWRKGRDILVSDDSGLFNIAKTK